MLQVDEKYSLERGAEVIKAPRERKKNGEKRKEENREVRLVKTPAMGNAG